MSLNIALGACMQAASLYFVLLACLHILVKQLVCHLNSGRVLRVQFPQCVGDLRDHAAELVVFLVIISVLNMIAPHDLWNL